MWQCDTSGMFQLVLLMDVGVSEFFLGYLIGLLTNGNPTVRGSPMLMVGCKVSQLKKPQATTDWNVMAYSGGAENCPLHCA